MNYFTTFGKFVIAVVIVLIITVLLVAYVVA
jgi:hypothetical protein